MTDWQQPPQVREVDDIDDEADLLHLEEAEQVGPDDPALPIETDEAQMPVVIEGPVLPSLRDRTPRNPIPAHMATPQIFVRWVASEARYVGSNVAYHSLRLLPYYLRVAKFSPLGVWRLLKWWGPWVTDYETRVYMRGVSPEASGPYDRIDKRHGGRIGFRWALTAGGIGCIWWAGDWAGANLRLWALLAMAAVLALLLGFLGWPQGKKIVDRGANFEVPKLSYDLIVNALNVLGIAQLTRSIKDFGPQQAVILRAPIGWQGNGWRCEFDLPAGVPASEVIEKRDRLASGLSRPVSAVWPATRPDVSANRLSLYVADKPLSQMKARPWPLLNTGQTSVFNPIPLGQDATGQPVNLSLIFTNGICGAQPRMGKTFSMRLIALGAALDPTCEMDIYNLKGGSDWSPFKQIAHRYRSGRKDEDFQYVLEGLRERKVDMDRRYDVIEELENRSPALVPEGKVTPELAARPELGLHPVLLMIDEIRVLFTDKRYKDEAIALMVDLCSLGPAAGIMAYSATQSVKKETVPPLISNMAIVRLCFRVQTYGESNLILGNLSGAGYNAATFNESEKGIGYLVGGEGEAPTVVRFAEVNGPQALAITTRARALRKTRGLLSGYAADQDLEIEDTDTPPLQHIADVWPGDRSSLGYHEIAAILADRHPVAYQGWTYRQVKDTCVGKVREMGSVKHQGQPMGRGIARDDLFRYLSDAYADEPAELETGDDE